MNFVYCSQKLALTPYFADICCTRALLASLPLCNAVSYITELKFRQVDASGRKLCAGFSAEGIDAFNSEILEKLCG